MTILVFCNSPEGGNLKNELALANKFPQRDARRMARQLDPHLHGDDTSCQIAATDLLLSRNDDKY